VNSDFLKSGARVTIYVHERPSSVALIRMPTATPVVVAFPKPTGSVGIHQLIYILAYNAPVFAQETPFWLVGCLEGAVFKY
jgi:hypothetical protein